MKLINFDDTSPGVKPFDFYQAQGVLIRTQRRSGAGPISVGDVITVTPFRNSFQVVAVPANATVSPPNFAFVDGVAPFLEDFLLEFTTPVKWVEIYADITPADAAPEPVRLIALERVAANQYRVLAFDEIEDNITSPSAARMRVDPGRTFRFALVEVTTEAEGFDNLRFELQPPTPPPSAVIPEPATALLMALAFPPALAAGRRRMRSAE